MDAAEAFGPGAAEELHEDGLSLVVEGVGGEDGVGRAGVDEATEAGVAELAGGLFGGLGLAVAAGLTEALGDAGVMDVERDGERFAESLDEGQVGVGLFGAEAVLDVDGGESDAECVAGQCVFGVQEQQEGDGICAAGDCGADALAGLEIVAVEGGAWCGHKRPRCAPGSALSLLYFGFDASVLHSSGGGYWDQDVGCPWQRCGPDAEAVSVVGWCAGSGALPAGVPGGASYGGGVCGGARDGD